MPESTSFRRTLHENHFARVAGAMFAFHHSNSSPNKKLPRKHRLEYNFLARLLDTFFFQGNAKHCSEAHTPVFLCAESNSAGVKTGIMYVNFAVDRNR